MQKWWGDLMAINDWYFNPCDVVDGPKTRDDFG